PCHAPLLAPNDRGGGVRGSSAPRGAMRGMPSDATWRPGPRAGYVDFKEEARTAPPGSPLLIVKRSENIPRVLDGGRVWILWAVFLLVPHIPAVEAQLCEHTLVCSIRNTTGGPEYVNASWRYYAALCLGFRIYS
ncbi:hypothetical protein L3Q82_008607, partial [Scortum barcoo]